MAARDEIALGSFQVKWLFIVLLTALCVYGALGAWQSVWFSPLHGVDLLIHECGHLITGLLGNELVMVMGGTLAQLAMPLAFLIYFYLQGRYAGCIFSSFWLAQNFFDVAVYARDAQALALPLISIGGDEESTIHDWQYMLNHWHAISHTQTVANVIDSLGWILLVATFVAGIALAVSHRPPVVHFTSSAACRNFLHGQ